MLRGDRVRVFCGWRSNPKTLPRSVMVSIVKIDQLDTRPRFLWIDTNQLNNWCSPWTMRTEMSNAKGWSAGSEERVQTSSSRTPRRATIEGNFISASSCACGSTAEGTIFSSCGIVRLQATMSGCEKYSAHSGHRMRPLGLVKTLAW